MNLLSVRFIPSRQTLIIWFPFLQILEHLKTVVGGNHKSVTGSRFNVLRVVLVC